MSLDPGTRLGPYEVVGVLGTGGMGEVYRARDTRLDREVAVKVLPEALAAGSERLRRFEDEARTAGALAHPNLLTIHDVGLQDGRPFMVTELLEGTTLREAITGPGLPPRKAVEWAMQIAEGLAAAHERSVVHRDLKPENLFVTRDGRIKILDFGLAKAMPAPALDAATATVRTSPGALVGTAGYMSPEQVRGMDADARADIFSLGTVLFEMLTGRRAFSGPSQVETLHAILNDDPPPVTAIRPVPAQLADVVRRCLEKRPEERFQSARDLAFALRWAETGTATVTVASTARSWAAAAVLVVSAAVGAAWVLSARRPAAEPPPAEERIERLTYDSGLTTTPALSRDGRLLAYASDRADGGDLDIWVQQLAGGEPLALTDDAADDHSPDFSPDGTLLAFQSERDGGGIYVVPTLGGTARLIARGGRRPRFSPDGRLLAYWTGPWRGDPALLADEAHVIPLAGGATARIAPGFALARDPVWAPDGRSLLLYGRRDPAGPASAAPDWWWAPLDGRPPVPTGASGRIQSLPLPATWSADGVLFSDGTNLWTLPVSSADGRAQGPPRRLTLGPGEYTSPAVGPRGQIVFTALNHERVVERVPLEGVQRALPARLHADSAAMGRASQTRDGAVIVFERGLPPDREVWVKDLRSGRQSLVVRVGAGGRLNATLSPDGSRIAYTAYEREDLPSGRGHVVETAGGVPRAVCEGCTLYGFLSDSRRVLAVAGGAIRAIDVDTGAASDLVARAGSFHRPHASPDDRLLAFESAQGGLMKTYVTALTPGRPASRESWRLVDEPTTTGRPCGWSADARTLYLLLDTDGFRCLWGQRVARDGSLTGRPYAVHHFHRLLAFDLTTSLGDAITRQGFMYEAERSQGNLWRLAH